MAKRNFELRIKLPDAKHMEYFQAALNIANAFRTAKREPVISMERLALNAIITGMNEIHSEYARMVEEARVKAAAERAAQEAVEEEKAEADNE